MNEDIIDNLCRLCATEDLDLSQPENNLAQGTCKRKKLLALVNKYMKIKITDDQLLPRKFCYECIEKLHSFDLFNKRCHDVQAMFISISEGNFLFDDHKDLVQSYSFLSKLEVSFKDETLKIHGKSSDETYGRNNDDDIVRQDAGNSTDDNFYENELDDTPLALRVSAKKFSDLKSKRGRSKKHCRKVPPLRIKAIKQEKTDVLNATIHDFADTKYEIHDEVNDTISKNGTESNAELGDNVDEDNESDDSNLLDESLLDEDKCESGVNPFALFEFRCNFCQELFENFSNLKKHCKKEHSSSAFVNCVCGKQLRARTAIIEHRRKHTGTSLFKCDTCSKTFNRRSLLCLHKISHMPKDEQPFVCCKCAKRFHTSSLLKKHEKVHLPEEERFLDVCNICQKKFTSKSAVNAHLRAVHYGEKPFVCEHCGNSFSSKAILTDHLTTHSSYAPWPCNVCGRNFKSKYRLNVHMDMHRSVKYRCPHCPMELSTRRTLRMHLLVHKEEKAYVCKVCSKAFRRSKDLKNHSNLHTGRRPYRCEFCERTFANGSNCRAHKLRMHPEELGVEKNCRNTSKPKNNSSSSVTLANNESDKDEQPVVPASVVDAAKVVIPKEYLKYEPKYDFNVPSQETDYSLEYARYVSPMNWNTKKPPFIQQPSINHLSTFAGEMHSDVPKIHHFLSYT